MSMYPSCSLCGGEILEADLHMMNKQVVGYQRPRGRRARGGLHALRIPRETGAVAHDNCVEVAASKAKRGIPVQQGGLF
jgi:hypothetical protein